MSKLWGDIPQNPGMLPASSGGCICFLSLPAKLIKAAMEQACHLEGAICLFGQDKDVTAEATKEGQGSWIGTARSVCVWGVIADSPPKERRAEINVKGQCLPAPEVNFHAVQQIKAELFPLLR